MKPVELWKLPEYPKTPHLPFKPNMAQGDVAVDMTAARIIFEQPVVIEEKIDGASVGICAENGNPIIRNRDHILKKGFMRKKKDTTAKMQFRSIWNYYYEHRKGFEEIFEAGPYSVYGEWMLAQHGLFYDKLPDWFIPYDIFNYEAQEFVSPVISRPLLEAAGFTCPMQHFQGLNSDGDYAQLEAWANAQTPWATEQKAEGLYVKVHNGQYVTKRYKMVREGFVQGALYDEKELKKNKVM